MYWSSRQTEGGMENVPTSLFHRRCFRDEASNSASSDETVTIGSFKCLIPTITTDPFATMTDKSFTGSAAKTKKSTMIAFQNDATGEDS
jgi:hypothetical protein